MRQSRPATDRGISADNQAGLSEDSILRSCLLGKLCRRGDLRIAGNAPSAAGFLELRSFLGYRWLLGGSSGIGAIGGTVR